MFSETYLHSPASDEIGFFKVQQRNQPGSEVRDGEIPSIYCPRVVPGTPTVLAMFTQTSEETRRLLRYQKEIRPGTEVVVPKPNLEGQLAGDRIP